MELLSKEIIERFKQKIPTMNQFVKRYELYGILHLDIVQEGRKEFKQVVLEFERLNVNEPEEYIDSQRYFYADVLVEIHDKVLYQIGYKEISLDDAMKQRLFKVYGDRHMWKVQLEGLRKILPLEVFEKPKEEEVVEEKVESSDDETDEEEWKREFDVETLPPQMKILKDSILEIRRKFQK